jgi:MarR family transcriptional regulator, transcriptional regulator for hemolysin
MSDSKEDWQPRTMPALLIATAARFLARLADARFRDLGISMSQLPVLVALKDGASLSQRELTRLAGVEQPSMAQLLARMERDGVIRRKRDPMDGRSSLISLTARTMKLIDPARAIMARGNREALAGFTEDEIKQLVAMLHRLIANVSNGSDCRPTSDAGVAPPRSNSRTDSR